MAKEDRGGEDRRFATRNGGEKLSSGGEPSYYLLFPRQPHMSHADVTLYFHIDGLPTISRSPARFSSFPSIHCFSPAVSLLRSMEAASFARLLANVSVISFSFSFSLR